VKTEKRLLQVCGVCPNDENDAGRKHSTYITVSKFGSGHPDWIEYCIETVTTLEKSKVPDNEKSQHKIFLTEGGANILIEELKKAMGND